jgi:hypothetical protein
LNKTELLRELQEEYRQWQSLLDQIGPERMEQPGVAGAWSVKDIVAHLTGWRRRTVGRVEAVARGEPEPPPPWPAHPQTDDEINAWMYASNYDRPVHEVLDESHQVFQQLVAAIESLSESTLVDLQHQPWMEGQPLRAGTFFAHFHEEHEADLRAWLAQVE